MRDPTVKELYDLTGKVGLVTGGGTTIGRQMAMALCEAGAKVAIASRRLEVCRKAAQEIGERTGGEAIALQLDVTNEEQVNDVVSAVVERLGGLDILVNNAGINLDTLIDKAKTADWQEVIDTNLNGTFFCSRAASRLMIEKGAGKIINISSIYGLVGCLPSLYAGLDRVMSGCSAAYAASKGGIVNLTRSMACYLAQWHINVNCISPGGIFSERTIAAPAGGEDWRFFNRYAERCPWGRMAEASEIKGLIVFLSSAASDYVTGAVIPLDGGWTAC